MGHSVEPFTSITVAGCVVVVIAAVALLLRGPVTARLGGRLALAALFVCFGLALVLDIFSIATIVDWDITQHISRRQSGTSPAWTSITVEAILGPVFLLLGAAALRGAK